MSDDKLAFLDKPRDEQGRFAPTKSEPAPAPATPEPPHPEPAPPAVAPEATAPAAPPQDPTAPTRPDPGYVPIAALLDTRDKLKKFQTEAEEYRRKFEEATAKRPEPIDPIADPDGYTRHQEQQLVKMKQDALFETSYLVALQQHGDETIAAAEEWLKSELERNPGMFATIARQRHPYDFVVKQHKKALRDAELGDDDINSAFEKWAAKNGYSKAQAQAAVSAAAPSPQPGTPLPKPSLASAPSAGSNAPKIPLGGQAAFEAVFKQ